jgi:hypothetical protein
MQYKITYLFKSSPLAQFYKPFYAGNLRLYKAIVFAHGRPFQHNLMFVGKADLA